MRNHFIVISGLATCALLASCGTPSDQGAEQPTQTEAFDMLTTPVGAVAFATSCNEDATELVERGVGLTHHMMYDEANFVFGMAGNADPDCAMANWGQAMTIINPLWPTTPSDEKMRRGAELVETALSQSSATDRERAYIETAAAYFVDGIERSKGERLQRFQDAWRILHETHPDDADAEAFYLLASLATANPNDRTLSVQRQVSEALDRLLETHPDHPGMLHYFIHANDYPELANDALTVADHYGDITPRVPHATHMMTHIYTRLGLWDKAIEWNGVSAETALTICRETGTINGHYTHALDYLAYAYLQIGDDASVMEIMETTGDLRPPYSGNLHTSAYALSAIPARFALERRDWQEAAQLTPRAPADFPWSEVFEPYIAITHFARAIGLARSGKPEQIERELVALAELRDSVASRNGYWAQQIEIQIQAADAWRLYALGETEDGLSRMKAAADLAMTTEKHAITPGEVLPTSELLGDMLYEDEMYTQALAAYEQSLNRSPGRLNSLHGAARAAGQAGQSNLATKYYQTIADMTEGVEASRSTVLEARDALSK